MFGRKTININLPFFIVGAEIELLNSVLVCIKYLENVDVLCRGRVHRGM